MKAIKHIAGILIATFGVLFVLAAVIPIVDGDPEVPWWAAALVFVTLGVLPLLCAFALLRKTLTAPGKPCPQCGGMERKPAGVLRPSHNLWLWHVGGWLFAALWGASRQQQVRCSACDTLYLTDTRASRIGGVLLWIFLLLLAFGILVDAVRK